MPDLSPALSMDSLRENLPALAAYYQAYPVTVIVTFFFIYLAVSTIAFFPGAIMMALAAGAVFDFTVGVIVVNIASSAGATLAFMVSRRLFREPVQRKFKRQLETINKGVEKDGPFYLIFLRMTPILPFLVVNVCMALTPMKARVFFIFSALGMIPGSLVFVNAGRMLAQIRTFDDILSWQMGLSFAAIGALPLAARIISRRLSNSGK